MIIVVIAVFFLSLNVSEAQTRHEFTYHQMGTAFRIVFFENDSTKAVSVANQCWQRLDSLNLTMSDYRSDSELMRLCSNAKPNEWYKISDDLFRVIAESQRAAELTNGLFDITISPLTKLWRRAKRQQQLPSNSQIKKAREGVGYQFFKLDAENRKISFLKKDIRLDLGGIGKGFALDELMKIIQQSGIPSAMIEAGGSIFVSNAPPTTVGWEIAIQNQNHRLANCGISTSGDAFQFIEIEGKRYAHILDPRTGLGFHEPHEVTIIAPNATAADWASTAVYLMDKTAIENLLQKTNFQLIQSSNFSGN